MNRRGFFRLVAGAGAWLATQHVAWAFPHQTSLLDLRAINQVLKKNYEPFIAAELNRRGWTDPLILPKGLRDEYNRMVEGDDRYRL